jgi:chitinase
MDANGITVVLSAGNAHNDDINQLPRITQSPQTFVNQIPNLIVVGASDKQSRAALFSREGSDMIWAPGHDIPAAGSGGQALATFDGTSFSAPLVAGLVAYYRGLRYVPGQTSPYDSPAAVKKLLKALSRTVQVAPHPQPQAPYVSGSGNKFSKVVPTVWNGQLDETVSCILTPAAEGCPTVDLGRDDITIDDIDDACETIPITRRRGIEGLDATLGRRQSGGACSLVPGNGGGEDGDNGGGGGEGGDDGGLGDQLGPPKTVIYSRGPPSPTCTANCGTYCTDFWCRPDRTGQPKHFTDPTRLATSPITLPSPTTPLGPGGTTSVSISTDLQQPTTLPPLPNLSSASWPTNCISTRTWTSCVAPGGQNIACGVTSSCAATATPGVPTPNEPSTRRSVTFFFVELTVQSGGPGPPYWSRYWSVSEGTNFCDSSSVFEKTESGASLQDPRYPLDMGTFRAHGRTCRYRGSSRNTIGRLECQGTNPDWWETCIPSSSAQIGWCGLFSNPMYKRVMECSWGEV